MVPDTDLIEFINKQIDKAQMSLMDVTDEHTSAQLKSDIVKYQRIIKILMGHEQSDHKVQDTIEIRRDQDKDQGRSDDHGVQGSEGKSE